MVLEKVNGCFVCTSHKPNADGYIRRWLPEASGKARAQMLHRFVWESVSGPIPEGHEVDHMCRVRACCNPAHLQCLPGKVHAIKGNTERYASVCTDMVGDIASGKMTRREAASHYGYEYTTVCRKMAEHNRNADVRAPRQFRTSINK